MITTVNRIRDTLRTLLPESEILQHQDQFQSGRPDTTVTYNGFTSWLEWKHLGPEQSIHSEHGLRKDQLDQLLKLERASLGRAWVIVFRKGRTFTDIYRPSALISVTDGKIDYVEPSVKEPLEAGSEFELMTRLYLTGVIRCSGHDFEAVAGLIWSTHREHAYYQHLRR